MKQLVINQEQDTNMVAFNRRRRCHKLRSQDIWEIVSVDTSLIHYMYMYLKILGKISSTSYTLKLLVLHFLPHPQKVVHVHINQRQSCCLVCLTTDTDRLVSIGVEWTEIKCIHMQVCVALS